MWTLPFIVPADTFKWQNSDNTRATVLVKGNTGIGNSKLGITVLLGAIALTSPGGK